MTNSRKRCAYCKEPQRSETMYVRGIQAFCNSEHWVEYEFQRLNKLKNKNPKPKQKTLRELNRETVKWQHDHTQRAFNRLRVLQELKWFYVRGLEPTCISCGKGLGGDQWCCGHFKSQGSNSLLRYDEKNTFLQHNRNCNQSLSGDIEGTRTTHGYKQGLIIRFGEAKGKEIIRYCEENDRLKDWECDELEAMRKTFRKTIRELEQEMEMIAA